MLALNDWRSEEDGVNGSLSLGNGSFSLGKVNEPPQNQREGTDGSQKTQETFITFDTEEDSCNTAPSTKIPTYEPILPIALEDDESFDGRGPQQGNGLLAWLFGSGGKAPSSKRSVILCCSSEDDSEHSMQPVQVVHVTPS